jgi:hypothetical protein
LLHIGAMNETKTALANNKLSWITGLLNWVFEPNFHVHQSEDNVSKVMHWRLLGGLFRIGSVIFMVPNLNGITVMVGVSRFHIDLDLFYIPRPEMEVQQDRIPNIISLKEQGIDYLTWFVGFEGIGIYRQKTFSNGYGVSKIDIGAHPMVTLGFANMHTPQTQNAMVGFQLMNLQIGVHSAWDTSNV